MPIIAYFGLGYNPFVAPLWLTPKERLRHVGQGHKENRCREGTPVSTKLGRQDESAAGVVDLSVPITTMMRNVTPWAYQSGTIKYQPRR
jgi:hypothetical protein